MCFPKLLVILSFLVPLCISAQSSDKADEALVKADVIAHGAFMIRMLNAGEYAYFIRSVWASNDATYISNGEVIKGYYNIESHFKDMFETGTKVQVKMIQEKVVVIDEMSATHIMEAEKLITNPDGSTENLVGVWSTYCNKVKNKWKAAAIHESYYPKPSE